MVCVLSSSTNDIIVIMQITLRHWVTVVLVLFPLYPKKDEKMDHDETNSLFLQSQMEDRAKVMDQEELKNPALKPQPRKNPAKPSLKDELFCNPEFMAVSGSMPLTTVFILLLIHTCGADLLAASISTVSLHTSPSAADLVSFILAVYAIYKWKRGKSDLESVKKEEDLEDVVTTLMEVKAELEDQRGRLKELLQEVEGEREVNKQKLRAVEEELTQREVAFEKPEELLKEKEHLLQAQWKLDETKKDKERQLLNTERLLEPIDNQVTRIRRKKDRDFE